jgi:hypothetical protein
LLEFSRETDGKSMEVDNYNFVRTHSQKSRHVLQNRSQFCDPLLRVIDPELFYLKRNL